MGMGKETPMRHEQYMLTAAKPRPVAGVPAGMTAVSHEEFFAFLAADPRDIMPSHGYRDYTTWIVVRDGTAIGRTLPGWAHPGRPKVYMLMDRRRHTGCQNGQ